MAEEHQSNSQQSQQSTEDTQDTPEFAESTVRMAAEHVKSDSIEPSTGLKLQCFIYTIVLISVGFVATVVETHIFLVKTKENTLDRWPIEWLCYGIKCGFILPAIGALLFLQYGPMRPGKIPRVRLELTESHATTAGVVTLKNVSRCVELPKSLSSTPSKPFILMSLIFAFFSCLSIAIEITCGVLYVALLEKNWRVEMSEAIRRLLLAVFIVVQTQFFLFYKSVCMQWQLKKVWLAASHVLASNVVLWFLNVGFELRELIIDEHNQSENTAAISHCVNTTALDSITRTLYPFLIEYYVMSALLAYAFLANTGRVAAAIRKTSAVSSDLIKRLLNPGSHERSIEQVIRAEYLVLEHFSRTIGLGVGLLLVALTMSTFVKVIGRGNPEAQWVIYCTQSLLYTSGIVCSVKLLRALKQETVSQKLSAAHRTDRILLWIGATAITVNGTYTIWNSLSNFIDKYDKQKMAAIMAAMMAACALLNISQSLIQIYALECALVRKFRSDSESGASNALYGRALLTFLILLNASEWLINTICFTFYFRSEMDAALALSLLTMPLQVFYRFHSIACIHDFKSHCEYDGHDQDAPQRGDINNDQLAPTEIEIDFPETDQHD